MYVTLLILKTKVLQISLIKQEVAPDQIFLGLSSRISVIIFNFRSLEWTMNSTFYSVSKLKYRNLNSFFNLLILLSGDISLNPGPNHQHQLQYLNKWNIFKSRGLHFIYLNINSLLPKVEEFRIIANSTNAAIIGISESKLDESVLELEIQIDNYKILQ